MNKASLKYSADQINRINIQAPLMPAPDGHTPITVAFTPNVPPSKLGETDEQYRWSLTALTVEHPSTAEILYTAKEGYKLVSVEIVIGNASWVGPLEVNPLVASLVDSNGYVYRVELGGRDGQIDTVSFNQDETAQGWVSFTIPQNSTPAYIKYEISFWTREFFNRRFTAIMQIKTINA